MTDPVWWLIRFASLGVALFGFLYKATCSNAFCVVAHHDFTYHPLTWLGWVGVLIALPAWATTVLRKESE